MSSSQSPKERLLDDPQQTAGVSMPTTAGTALPNPSTNNPQHPIILLKLKQPSSVTPSVTTNETPLGQAKDDTVANDIVPDDEDTDNDEGTGHSLPGEQERPSDQEVRARPENLSRSSNAAMSGSSSFASTSGTTTGPPSASSASTAASHDGATNNATISINNSIRSAPPHGLQPMPMGVTIPPMTGSGSMQITDAIAYLERVRTEFADQPDVYNRFLQVMRDFKANK